MNLGYVGKTWIILAALLSVACATTVPRKNPIGTPFPETIGTALNGKSWVLPKDLRGEYTLLLIGFTQNAQFDIDRWLIGIDQKGYRINVFEVPTVKGWLPGLFASKIDDGMRSGIPNELWKIVITVYKDADKIVTFLGNEDGLNARAVVLDKTGKVVYLHDRGFSVAALNQLGRFFSVTK